MRKPKWSDCKDENDEFDSECYEDAIGQYEDFKRDEYLDEIGDQIHEQRKDEKDELHRDNK